MYWAIIRCKYLIILLASKHCFGEGSYILHKQNHNSSILPFNSWTGRVNHRKAIILSSLYCSLSLSYYLYYSFLYCVKITLFCLFILKILLCVNLKYWVFMGIAINCCYFIFFSMNMSYSLFLLHNVFFFYRGLC